MTLIKSTIQQHDAQVETGLTALRSVVASGSKAADFNYNVPNMPAGGLGASMQQTATRRKYEQFRGWVHSAIHALAFAASKQPVIVAKDKESKKQQKALTGTKSVDDKIKLQKRLDPRRSDHMRKRMPKQMAVKSSDSELEIQTDHPFLDALENPNPYQSRFDFVYTFVSNICLTGFGYIIYGVNDETGEPEFYALPSSWVQPVHKKGPYAQFKVVDPANPTAEVNDDDLLDGSQVAFARLPLPGSLIGGAGLAHYQDEAIQIDQNIQSSQLAFFKNGIFPSVLITVGTDPHPEAPRGVRPRLTAPQRRQVYSVIRKMSAGVANYGNPAIIDGMIEKIERMSATQNEMGWEKSENAVRTRILSAFGVHPFILGEAMAGSYAQAYTVYELFYDKVNCFLDLLGSLVSVLVGNHQGEEGTSVYIYWEQCEATDPSMEKSKWETARTRGDVTKNEWRAWAGLAPEDVENEPVFGKEMMTPFVQLLGQVAKGQVKVDQAVAILTGMGLPTELAEKIIGEGPSEEELARQQQQNQPPANQQQGQAPPPKNDDEDTEPAKAYIDAIYQLAQEDT